MLNVWLLNGYESVLLLLAVAILGVYYKKAGYSRKEIIVWIVILLPVFYFSINMVTEAVTTDEPKYEACITDIRHIKERYNALAVLYEYKFAQLTEGSLFWLLPGKFRERLGADRIWILYKCVHWLIMYLISLITVWIWRKCILLLPDEKRTRVAENAILASLVGLPLTCLMIKVTNYDAGSTYPAILGMSMLWAAYNKKSTKLGFWAATVTALGVLDKWTALPYWVIAVILYAFLKMREQKTMGAGIGSMFTGLLLAYAGAIGVSFGWFVYAGIQQGGFVKELDFGIVVFSFTHIVKALYSGDMKVNSSASDVICIPILLGLMAVCTLLLYFCTALFEKHKASFANVVLKIDGILIIAGIAIGVAGAYLVPATLFPYTTFDEGLYVAGKSFDGLTYSYGAKNAVGHLIGKIVYQWATVMVNYPLPVMVLLGIAAVLMLVKHQDDRMIFPSFVLSASLGLILLYAVAGMPAEARYNSYPMLVLVMTGIYFVYTYVSVSVFVKGLLSAGYVIYAAEMLLYVPNYKCFSPMWLWHSAEYNNEIRTGQFYAGEAMFWSEHVAVAGNMIKAVEGTERCSDIVVFCDSIAEWPMNPGYSLRFLGTQSRSDLRFDDDAYYVFHKFALFRGETPRFIEEQEPMMTIRFKGEIGAWIYRGDQIEKYAESIPVKKADQPE